MTSIIKLHCLSGAMDESPPCYVLQVDEFKFLLDCGWDENFDIGMIKELKRHVNSIDAVLLSHPDPLHLGALPYAVGKLGLSCPIYATLPVYKMGQMFMYDLFQAHHNMTEFDLFSLDDVDAAFDRITQLKYNQSVNMKGKGLGIKITPMAAGHMIGGTVWRISKEGEEDIVYAVDFNHKKERHLNACELERVTRPALLLTDALNSDYIQPRRRTRDEKLMTTILSTLRGGGCVLVCTDTAGRVLELAHMLDQLWRNRDSGLVAYSLLMLSNVSYNVIEFAKSQIEWMSDKLTRAFEGARSNPFALRHVQLAHSLHEVTRTPGPKVVLASHPDLESGFARDLFLLWCQQPQNSIVLTTRTGPGTLARKLLDGEREMEVLVKRRVRLEGAELEEWLRTRRPRIRADPAPLSSDSDSDEELEMRVLTGRHDIPVKTSSNSTTHYFKVNKRHHAMYPFFEERTRSDDYGEIIKVEDYRLAEPMETENEVQPVQVKTEPEPEEWVEAATKCVVVTRQISIKASVVWVELEGRTDGESLLRLVSTIKPRTLVALRGGEKQSKHLARYCEELSIKAVTPNTGDVLDLTPNTQIFQVKLTDALMSRLSWKKTPRAELAWLCARISAKPLEKINDAQPADDTANEEILSLEPAQDDGSIEPHTAAFINELKLSELKQALARNGLSSEFSGGALSVCNGTIAIRREGSHVTLEGVLSEEYYKVRELLYEQFAIV